MEMGSEARQQQRERRERSNSWPPQPGRIGSARWTPHSTDRRMDKSYSYQSCAMIKDALRLAITCCCQVAIFFIPRSGQLRSFSTAGTAIEFLQIYNAMLRYARQSRARLSTNFADIQSRFSAGAPWLENAIQRLGHLGVSRDCLRRFHRVYQAVLPKYRSANGLMADIAARLEQAITEFCDKAKESLSRDDEVNDLTEPSSRTPPPPAGSARARAGPLPTGRIISMTTPAVTDLYSVPPSALSTGAAALLSVASSDAPLPGYRGATAQHRAMQHARLDLFAQQHLANIQSRRGAAAAAEENKMED